MKARFYKWYRKSLKKIMNGSISDKGGKAR